MLRIRLARHGANKRPFYWIVVIESHVARDGKFVERLGFFNPIATGKEERLKVNLERLAYWESVGAKPSDRVTELAKEYSKKAQTPADAA